MMCEITCLALETAGRVAGLPAPPGPRLGHHSRAREFAVGHVVADAVRAQQQPVTAMCPDALERQRTLSSLEGLEHHRPLRVPTSIRFGQRAASISIWTRL